MSLDGLVKGDMPARMRRLTHVCSATFIDDKVALPAHGERHVKRCMSPDAIVWSDIHDRVCRLTRPASATWTRRHVAALGLVRRHSLARCEMGPNSSGHGPRVLTLRVLLRGPCALSSPARSPPSPSAWSPAAAPAARTRTTASCSRRFRGTHRRRSPPPICRRSRRATIFFRHPGHPHRERPVRWPRAPPLRPVRSG
jgi:hypothetical protein